jgi:hypothetical protein
MTTNDGNPPVRCSDPAGQSKTLYMSAAARSLGPGAVNQTSRILKSHCVGDSFPCGHRYRAKVLARTGDWILIEKRKPTFKTVQFEAMFIRRLAKDRIFPNGIVYLAGSEFLPCDEEWGTFGFSFPNEDTARQRFSELAVTEPALEA